ncbi:hypothetical protein F5Y12DRAFT_793213 [Xylaria sp. FL1777]|nr:hypothetical protein F5Y12DRAFT_793213 [Xylaria sp. FL1777]
MCFTEYVAYTCGHTSTAVNRPCPMTTHLHSNPCCSMPACRPFLAPTMCNPCNRIMHGRRVDIAEYEHRWMHERGACDCEVRFPGLTQPRLVKRSSIVEGEKATASAINAGAGASVSTSAGSSALSEQDISPTTEYYADNLKNTQSNVSGRGEESAVPLYMEAQVGNNVEVAVRLISLYGAEWTKDHAKLHHSGKCKCPVSFERYKPLDSDYDQDEDDSPGLYYSDSPDQSRKTWNDLSTPKDSYNPQAPVNFTPSHEYDARTPPSMDKNFADGPHYPYIPTGQVARWAMEGPQGSLLDEILGPIGPDASIYREHPVDIQTMHYPNSGIPISGDPIVCGTFHEGALPSIVEYRQPKKTLAGFPIGAGPEGESHAGDFETCSLQSSYEDSPVKMRRLSSEF